MAAIRSIYLPGIGDALSPQSWAEVSDQGSSFIRKHRESTSTTSPQNSPTGSKEGFNGRPPDSPKNETEKISDDTSEIDVDIQARQLRALERVEILRRRALRKRALLKGRRQYLRSVRQSLRDALDTLNKRLKEVENNETPKELKELEPHFQALQDFYDELAPAEDAYEELEDQLEDAEYDFEQEEAHFYRHFDVSRFSITDERLDEPLSPLGKAEAPSESDTTSEEIVNNPRQEYIDKCEEAEYLKEELDTLENDFFHLSQEASFRKRHNIPLSAESATFLAEYEMIHARALEDLHTVEQEVLSIREECIEQGLFNESEYSYAPRDALKEELLDFVEDARRDRSPLRIAAQNIEYGEQPHDYDDKRDYVNKWLLQWVQNSSLEALMLRAWIFFKYPGKAKELAEDEWSELAVEQWDVDGMGEDANESYKASRMDVIVGDDTMPTMTGLSISLGSLKVGLDEVRDGEEGLLEIEEGSQGTAKNDEGFLMVMRPRSNTM